MTTDPITPRESTIMRRNLSVSMPVGAKVEGKEILGAFWCTPDEYQKEGIIHWGLESALVEPLSADASFPSQGETHENVLL